MILGATYKKRLFFVYKLPSKNHPDICHENIVLVKEFVEESDISFIAEQKYGIFFFNLPINLIYWNAIGIGDSG